MNIMDMIEKDEQREFDSEKLLELKKIKIENYRSIESETLEFDNGSKCTVFSGESGTGKTTRIEAILWALTDTLFDGSTNGLNDFITPKGSEQGTLTSVELHFYIADEPFVFTKQMKEKWVRKRGTDDIVFEGTDTTYYFNGTKQDTKKDYQKLIYRAFGLTKAIDLINKETTLLSKANIMNLILNLDYFLTLDNKTLRELVLLVGGKTDITQLEMGDILRKLLKQKNNDVDELKKTFKQQLKGDKNNQGLYDVVKALDTQIETYEKQVNDVVSDLELTEAIKRLNRIDTDIIDLKVELSKGAIEIEKEYDYKISDLELKARDEIDKIKQETEKEQNEKIKVVETEIDKTQTKYNELMENLNSLLEMDKSARQTIKQKEYEIKDIRERGAELVAEKKELENGEEINCPLCKQNFIHVHNPLRVNEINFKLQELKNKIKEREFGITEFNNDLVSLDKRIKEISKEIEETKVILDSKKELVADENAKRTQTLETLDLSNFNSKEIISIKEELNALKKAKSNVEIEHSIQRQQIKTKIANLEREKEQLKEISSKGDSSTKFQRLLNEAQDLRKEKQQQINTIEQLEMELKMLNEDYLREVDKQVKNAFGENIKFKLFETNTTNDNIVPTCEMLVKDSFGRWVNAINGINTGHSVPRLVEFLSIVKNHLGARKSILLIDFFESIGNEPLQELLSYGENVIATQVVRGQNELKVESL